MNTLYLYLSTFLKYLRHHCSQMMRGQAPKYFFLEPPLVDYLSKLTHVKVTVTIIVLMAAIFFCKQHNTQISLHTRSNIANKVIHTVALRLWHSTEERRNSKIAKYC